MRNFIGCFSLLVFFTSVSSGQEHASFKISKTKETPTLKSILSVTGALYAGIPNIMVLTDTVLPASKYIITTISPGIEVTRNGNKISVSANAARINDTIVFFISKTNNKDTVTLNVEKVLVKKIPDPVLAVGGKPLDGKNLKTELLKYKKLVVYLADDLIGSGNWFKCSSFDMEIGSNNFHTNSATLTSSMIQTLASAPNGAIISFANVMVIGPDGISRSMGTINVQLGQ
jgi:hypothetical protein